MRLLIKGVLWLTGLAALVALFLVVLVVLDSRPRVVEAAKTTPAERNWARHWIAAHDPRRMRQEQVNRLTLDEREANLLLNELLGRTGQGRGQLQLAAGRATLALSLKLPLEHLDGYLNLELDLVAGEPLPEIRAARVAGLPIPAAVIQGLAEQTFDALDRARVVQRIDFEPRRLALDYAWRPDMIERIGGGLVAASELPAVLAYQQSLVRFAEQQPQRRALRLADLLAHLLTAPSTQGSDAVTDNRALIMALAAYVNGRLIRDPADDSTTAGARPRPVLLRGRRDLGQHFMVSAALAIQGNDSVSGLIGWYKEMADSQGGSGFSFADMTANRAGIRFAKLATANQADAQWLRAFARRGLSEDDFMPPIDSMPEGLSQARFNERFAESRRQEYLRLIDGIDRHIESRQLYRRPPG